MKKMKFENEPSKTKRMPKIKGTRSNVTGSVMPNKTKKKGIKS